MIYLRDLSAARSLRTLAIIAAALGPLAANARGQDKPASRPANTAMQKLIEEIATGDDTEREDAEEELIERVAAPLARALEAVDARPVAQQVRLQHALVRVQAALRIQVARGSLGPEDRKLFDDFLKANRAIVEPLFDEDPHVRELALQRIPLKPGTGASVFVALKVNDADETVHDAALELAAKLKDDVIARCLTQYVRSIAEVLRSDIYGPSDVDSPAVLAMYARRAIEVIGAAKYREAVPTIIETLRQVARTRYAGPGFFELPAVAQALGNIGDRRAAPVLVEFLDHAGASRNAPFGQGRVMTISVGDEMLLALIKLYELQATDFDLQANEAGVFGYLDDEARREGHRKFHVWYQEHGEKTPASQPAGETSRK